MAEERKDAMGDAMGVEAAEGPGLMRNMSWSTLGTVARILIAGGGLALVSRQVTTTEMGLYGIGWAGASLGYTISLNGAAQAIIAVPNMERAHIGAAQFLSLVIGGITAGALIAISPFAASFYRSADAGHAVVVGALFVPLMCLGAVDIAQAQKELRFSALTIIQICAVLLAALTSLGLAYAGEGLLALFALQGLIGFYVFVVSRLTGVAPGFYRFGWRHLAEIWNVGLHLSLGSLTGAFWLNMPQLLIGKVATVETLGLYVFCSRVVQLIFAQLSGMINNVIYPTFARLRDNPARVGASFLQTVRFTYFCLNLPLLVLAAGPAAFLVAYGGEKWASGSIVLFYMALAQMIIALGANVFPTFAAMGKPSVAWRWNLFITFVQGAGILIAAPFGIVAIVQSLTLTALVMPLAVWWLSKVVPFRMRDYARNMTPIALSLVPAIALGQLVESRLHQPALIVLTVTAAIGTAVFVTVAFLIDASLRQQLVAKAISSANRNRL
jgi:O-antigen/teichoic acid export membrane protein